MTVFVCDMHVDEKKRRKKKTVGTVLSSNSYL